MTASKRAQYWRSWFRDPWFSTSAASMQIIGPNKGINKAVAKGPIVMIIAVVEIIAIDDNHQA